MSYADFKANTIQLTNGVSNITLTPTTLFSDGILTISNVNLSGSTGVTVSSSDNSSNLATTAFVKAQTPNISGYAQLASVQTWTATQNFSTITASTPATSDNSSTVATTAFVKAQTSNISGYAQLASVQTWTATQNFSTITTNKIDGSSSTAIQTVGSNITTGTVSVASGLTAGGTVNVGTTSTTTNIKGNVAIETLNIANIALTGSPPFVYLPDNRFSNFFGATDTGWVQTFNVPNNSNWVFGGKNGIVTPASYFVNWWVAKGAETTSCRIRIVGTTVTQTTGTTLTGGAPFENAGLIFKNTMSGGGDVSGMGFFQAGPAFPNMWMTIENYSTSNAFYTTRMLIFRVA
jgi:hypothetical protein